MTYKLEFHKKALKEWKSLSQSVRERFKKKLAERQVNPRAQADRMRGNTDRYKIKLMRPALRLVYEVDDERGFIKVVVIGERANNVVYIEAARR